MYLVNPDDLDFIQDHIADLEKQLVRINRLYRLYVFAYYGLSIPAIALAAALNYLPPGANIAVASLQAVLAFLNLPQLKDKLVADRRALEALIGRLKEERLINFISQTGSYRTGGELRLITNNQEFDEYLRFLGEYILENEPQPIC